MKTDTAQWRTIRRLLREARHRLPASMGLVAGSLQEFEEFLEQNELELAWDSLRAVADRVHADAACWALLAEAAIRMGLSDKAVRAVKKVAAIRKRAVRRVAGLG